MNPPCGVNPHGVEPNEPMKTRHKLNQLFLNCFSASSWRICRAGPVLAACLFGSLLTAQGQDPIIQYYDKYPWDTNASLGDSVYFTVTATSTNPPITYQWLHEGTNLPGATSRILLLTNLTLAHAGGYMVMVSNASGDFTNSRTATLTVDPTFVKIMTGPGGADSTGSVGAAWGDYDGDGYPDLFIANWIDGSTMVSSHGYTSAASVRGDKKERVFSYRVDARVGPAFHKVGSLSLVQPPSPRFVTINDQHLSVRLS